MTRLRLAAALCLALAALCGERASAAGDAARGEAIYDRCLACHALDRNRVGPKHCGLFGRRAGGLDGFRYSPAMRRSGIVWSEETLDRFLENPTATVPGTTMTYAGIKDAKERANLIAWLERATVSPEACP